MKNWKTPLGIVIVVGTVVLGAELLLMELLHQFLRVQFKLPDTAWAAIDAVTLTAILTPTLYFLVFRKMRGDALRFQKISAAVQDAMVIINGQGRITDWNSAAQQMFQYSREEALGQALHPLLAPPRYHADAARGFALFQKTGDGPVIGKTIELVAQRKNGSEFPIELSLSALRIEGCWHAIGIIRDISERKQAAEVLQICTLKHQLLFESSRDALMLLTPPSWKFTEANQATLQLFGAVSVAEFTAQEPWAVSPERQPDGRLSSEKAREMIAIALREGSHFFEWEHRRLDGSLFAADVLLTCMEAGRERFLQATVRDISERKQAENSLRESEERFRSLFENMLEGYAHCKMLFEHEAPLDFIYLNVNGIFEQITGLKDVIGKKITELIPGIRTANPELFEIYGRVALTGQPEKFETYVDALGAWFSITAYSPCKDHFIAIFDDITERKRAEEAVERERRRLETILRTSGDGIHILDAEGLLVDASDAFLSMLGYDRAAAIGRLHCYDWDVQLDEETIRRNIKKLLTCDEPLRIETRHRRGDGGFIDVEVTTNGFEFGGQGYICASSRDVTERNQSERVLSESEARLNLALEATLIGIWDWDIKHDLWYASPTYFTMLGYEPEEGPTDRAVWLGRLHPDDRQAVAGKIDEILRGGDTIYQYEARMRHADGAYRWVAVQGKTVERDETGRASRIRGVRIDITERKLMEQANQEANTRTNKALEDAIIVIAATLEQRDPYTAGHQRRVAELATTIAREMELAPELIEGIHFGGLIHDIGKISVPAEILCKPGRLTDIEFGLIKTHAEAGYEIIKDIAFPWPIADMVRQHHERLDGSGYPQGLKGDQIRLEARILAVADIVEAMSANRPYRPGLGLDEALNEIMRCRGAQLDPDVVDACLRVINEQGFIFSKE